MVSKIGKTRGKYEEGQKTGMFWFLAWGTVMGDTSLGTGCARHIKLFLDSSYLETVWTVTYFHASRARLTLDKGANVSS